MWSRAGIWRRFGGRLLRLEGLRFVMVWYSRSPCVVGVSGVARQRVTFFCFAKRKSPKKRRPCCLRPFAALRATCGARSRRGPARTRFAQTIAVPDPSGPVLLGAYRRDFRSRDRVQQFPVPVPESPVLAGPVNGVKSGIRAARCSSRRRVCADPRFWLQSQVARRAPDCGSPFFCLLFFGEAKKSEALSGAPDTPTPQGNQNPPKYPP